MICNACKKVIYNDGETFHAFWVGGCTDVICNDCYKRFDGNFDKAWEYYDDYYKEHLNELYERREIALEYGQNCPGYFPMEVDIDEDVEDIWL